jgi:hypothetical protein
MRRASLSFRPGEKSSFVVTGRRGRSRTLMGDGESGIVLDDKDEGDSYYAEMAKKVGEYLQQEQLEPDSY